MSGDLEDFLRRAAARRQTKTGGQPSQPNQPQQQGPAERPATRRREYTNRHRERVPQATEVAEEPIAAEIVSDELESLSDQRRRIEAAKQRAENIRQQANDTLPQPALSNQSGATTSTGATRPTGATMSTGNTAEDLLRMLRHPGGLRQAVLLREILDRPEHRW